MRWVAVGVEPVGVVAIGANATGIIAIGQLATGVIAVGQLSRGVFVLGQLALGIVSVGQLSIGVVWAAGQVGLAATAGPGLIYGAFGRLYPNRLRGKEAGPAFVGPSGDTATGARALGLVVFAILLVVWWRAVRTWLVAAITRTVGIYVDPEPVPIFR